MHRESIGAVTIGKGKSFTFLILHFHIDSFTTSMYYFCKYNKNKLSFFERGKRLNLNVPKKRKIKSTVKMESTVKI